jgi:hypothetical protein
MHPDWLSNSFAIADKEGGTALFVDSGADIAPLVAAVERWGATPAAILRTHSHSDHVVHESSCGAVRGGRRRRARRVAVGRSPGARRARRPAARTTCRLLRKRRRLHRRHAVPGRRQREPRAGAELRDGRLHGPSDETRTAGAHRQTTIGRERSRTVRPRLERCRAGGAERVEIGGREATLSSGRPTTTARAMPGCASTTARTPSSAGRASSAEPGRRPHVEPLVRFGERAVRSARRRR